LNAIDHHPLESTMVNPFRQLQDDHKNLARVLRLLRREVGKYDDPDDETDLNLLLEGIDHLNDYPHHYHHPLEEAAFAYMLEHKLGDAEVIEYIQGQHKELEGKTRELKALFELVASDQVVPVSQVKEVVDSYLDPQFAHLNTEARDIFPVMEECLDQSAWEVITRDVEEHIDPLFRGDPASFPKDSAHSARFTPVPLPAPLPAPLSYAGNTFQGRCQAQTATTSAKPATIE